MAAIYGLYEVWVLPDHLAIRVDREALSILPRLAVSVACRRRTQLDLNEPVSHIFGHGEFLGRKQAALKR